jgi:hypothetical protein
MCATCTVRAMHVPRVRYTSRSRASCTVCAVHVPRVRYVPCKCHVYGTCHACATCTVQAMHVPRVRYAPCMCHVYGTCHACARCCCVSLVAIPDTKNRFIAYICTLIQTKPGVGHLGCRPVFISMSVVLFYSCDSSLFRNF